MRGRFLIIGGTCPGYPPKSTPMLSIPPTSVLEMIFFSNKQKLD